MGKRWPEEKILHLGFLIEQGLTNVQIGKEFSMNTSTIQLASKRYFNGNPNYRNKKTKHKHLRKPVFEYFLNHTWSETKEKFKLTDSELKSVFTVGYRDNSLKSLRKDTRCRRLWDTKDTIFLLQRAGLIRREKIGMALGRGKDRVIKEKLMKLGVNTKTIQGMTLSSYRKNFGQEPSFAISTKAGPSGGIQSGMFKIIPWVILREELNNNKIIVPKIFADYIKTMALFQEWIFEGQDVIRKMLKIIKDDSRKRS